MGENQIGAKISLYTVVHVINTYDNWTSDSLQAFYWYRYFWKFYEAQDGFAVL